MDNTYYTFADSNISPIQLKKKMPSVYVKVFIHVFSLSILFGSLALFYFVGKPFKRGFFCHDPALSYPFRKSTVTSVMLYTLCSLTAIKMIVFTELALMFFESHKFTLLGQMLRGTRNFRKRRIRQSINYGRGQIQRGALTASLFSTLQAGKLRSLLPTQSHGKHLHRKLRV